MLHNNWFVAKKLSLSLDEICYSTFDASEADKAKISLTRQLNIAHGQLTPPQHHLYNGLARPVDFSIFAMEWTHPSLCWHSSGLACTAACWPTVSVLAYGQRDGSRCCHGTDTGKAGQRDGHIENIMPPLQAMPRTPAAAEK